MKSVKILLTGLLFVICFSSSFGLGQTEKDDAPSSGTGFFINSDGVIITNAHVIDNANNIYIAINKYEYYSAQIIERNDDTDLAVLKINYKNPYHFKIADFNTINTGDRLSILGFPLSDDFGFNICFSEGSLSDINGPRPHFFQHSAPSQPGNSGGPIMNSRFEVIGVNTAVLKDSFVKNSVLSSQNVSFGVNSGYIHSLLNNIIPGNGNISSLSDAEKATVQIISTR